MNLRSDLLERFDYDLWANKQWLPTLGKFKDISRAQATFEHILTAQRVWLSRLGVEVSQAGEDMSVGDLLALVNRAWKMVLTDGMIEQPVVYQNRSGMEFSNTVGQIAAHVVNHGTYHRGQLRGQAQAEGLDQFPETDLIVFYRERTMN